MDEFVAPSLIIAMPQLLDPNFHRTVVLLVEKNEEGAFGLVINRSGDSKLTELCENLEATWGGDEDALALYGGPVGTDQGFVLHGEVPPDLAVHSKPVLPGVHIASDMETFRVVCARPPRDLRVLLGYAGWGPGQLDREIVSGAWLTTAATPELIFRTPVDETWERALRQLGIDPAMLVTTSGGLH